MEYNVEKQVAIPALGHYPQELPTTGTTLIAMEYDGGVIVGTDARTGQGTFVSCRVAQKITELNERTVVLRAGAAAHTQAIADIVNYEMEAHSIMDEVPITVYRSAQIFRKYLYNYREQLNASVILAGHDDVKGGQIYSLPFDGYVLRQHFAAQGSGSTIVAGYLDQAWKQDMTRDEVKEVIKQAVFLAIVRDRASGGIIRIADITKDGIAYEIIRPDTAAFPKLNEPPSHKQFPEHIAQNETEKEVVSNSEGQTQEDEPEEEDDSPKDPKVDWHYDSAAQN